MTKVYYVSGTGIPDFHGIVCRTKDEKHIIIINADQPPEVQREALRHEVGHILYGDFDIPGGSVAEIENEAHARGADARIDAVIQTLPVTYVDAETYATHTQKPQNVHFSPWTRT